MNCKGKVIIRNKSRMADVAAAQRVVTCMRSLCGSEASEGVVDFRDGVEVHWGTNKNSVTFTLLNGAKSWQRK